MLRALLASVKHEWPVKVASLLIAIVLWSYVVGSNSLVVTVRRSMPVQVVNLASGLRYSDLAPPRVSVTLRAARSIIRSTAMGQVRAELNAAGRGPGTLERAPTLANLPRDVELLTPVPPVRVTLSREETEDAGPSKVLPVLPALGNPAPGLMLRGVQVIPTTVLVGGDEGRLEELAYLRTERIDISQLRASGKLTARLRPPEGVRLFGSDKVTVSVQVGPAIPGQAVGSGQPPEPGIAPGVGNQEATAGSPGSEAANGETRSGTDGR